MRFNSGQPKNFLSLNTILKNKKIEESDFRVHFTLKGVFCQNKNYQEIIDDVANRINFLCRVHLVQIDQEVDDNLVDISVGLFNDNEACRFLASKKTIKLMDKNKSQKQYEPVISRAFQSFMRKIEKLKSITLDNTPKIPQMQQITSNIEQQPQLDIENNSNMNIEQEGSKRQIQVTLSLRQNPKNPFSLNKKEEIILLSDKNQNMMVEPNINLTKHLWLFGIPSQFQYEDIKKVFQNKGIQVVEGTWVVYDRMQYLQVTLTNPIPLPKVFQQLCFKVQNYPFLTIPKLKSPELITTQLSKFTLQLTFANTIVQQQSVINSLDELGGVNILIRNVHSQQKEIKFLVVFNNIMNVERGSHKMSKQFRDCVINRKNTGLSIGRVMKYYTFESLMVEISKNNKTVKYS